MVKTLKILFSGTDGSISTKVGMYYWGLWPIIVCMNYDLGLTMTYCTAKVKFGHIGFSMERLNTDDQDGRHGYK